MVEFYILTVINFSLLATIFFFTSAAEECCANISSYFGKFQLFPSQRPMLYRPPSELKFAKKGGEREREGGGGVVQIMVNWRSEGVE